tara:strand:+ start:356 stop:622 length:267 start_codon:yes stop_codon:yes gene_type:complete
MLELYPNLIVSFFTIIICVLVFICFNLYKKIIIYESWVTRIRTKINSLKTSIEEIDDRNLFETDDDVGAAYEEISELIKDFDDETELK